MRLIDADALIEKCGGWYVDECTESGFIGTLENILATEPTIQPDVPDTNVGNNSEIPNSSDCISRQQAIDAINHICPVDTDYDSTLLDRVDVRYVLSDLPSVQPKPQEGRWIPHETPDGGEQYECSECGVLWEFNDGSPEDNEAYFCPKCGAKMKGVRQK